MQISGHFTWLLILILIVVTIVNDTPKKNATEISYVNTSIAVN